MHRQSATSYNSCYFLKHWELSLEHSQLNEGEENENLKPQNDGEHHVLSELGQKAIPL